MTSISTVTQLRLAIAELESARTAEWLLLKEQVLDAAVVLRPQNIVETTVKSFFKNQDFKSIAFHSVLGITTGLVANTLLRKIAVGPVSKFVAGTVMGMISNTKVLNHSPGVISVGAAIFKKIFSRS
jgi:hypothetical protein